MTAGKRGDFEKGNKGRSDKKIEDSRTKASPSPVKEKTPMTALNKKGVEAGGREPKRGK